MSMPRFLRRNSSYRNKIELEKKHLNKQMIQSMQGLRNVNGMSHAITFLNNFSKEMKSTLKTYFNA